MKQVIPFSKEIVFKTAIASITSISLEHEEKVYDGEVSGDFIIFGDYKAHNDTTEKELFKYRLPFTAILPEHVMINTVKVDIEDFTYDQIEEDVIKVNVDFSITYDEEDVPEEVEEVENRADDEVIDAAEQVQAVEQIDDETVKEIEEFLQKKEEPVVEEDNREVLSVEETTNTEKKEAVEEVTEVNKNEYVKYHIHIVKENETLEQIIKLYDTSLDTVKLYNEVDKLKMGDKLIIPEYQDD